MKFFDDLFILQNNAPYYYNFTMFLILHWVRISLGWCHKTWVQPIVNFLQTDDKKEPLEDEWIQIYTLTRDSDTAAVSTPSDSYRSFDKYFFPYTNQFLKFVEYEFNFFRENPIMLRDDTGFFKTHEIIENLFIVKMEKQYIVKSFPSHHHRMTDLMIDWKVLPNHANISFSFIEYYHPRMRKPLEIILPTDFYTIGNELFTNAFVLRQLELMNCYFVYDHEYEIHFIDHQIKEVHLKFDEYIVMQEHTYNTKKRESEEDSPAIVVEEEAKVLTEPPLEDSSSSSSEKIYWWIFA